MEKIKSTKALPIEINMINKIILISFLMVLTSFCFIELQNGFAEVKTPNKQIENVIRTYLDNIKKHNFKENYNLLSKKALENWAQKGIIDRKSYEKLKSSEEIQVINYKIEEINFLSNDKANLIVRQKEKFESPVISENKYRYRLVKEKNVWKIDNVNDLNSGDDYLP